ncbi:MAG: exodeoxyribonuclease VII small subunit [Eubacterium sp.]|nr:exodeoxyribonuclease VII small subunit [Eubacterium sp.]
MGTTNNNENNNFDDFDLEAALSRMDEINTLLSREGTSLQESLELYKEGVALAGECKKRLEGVEKQLKIINPEGQQND